MQSRKFKVAMIICALAFIGVIILFSPFFYLEEVIIRGYNTVSRQEIEERLEITGTTNLLFFNLGSARRRLTENLYIANVEFTRRLPGTLYVEVQERRLAAYVEHTPGMFLFLDEFGRVLEVRSFTTQPLPVIEGLNFNHFALGEVLQVPDTTAFNIMTQYAQLIYRHGLVSRVTHINVSDTANTRILVGYIEFNVGGIDDAELKVRTIAGMLSEMPEAEFARGFVDLRENRPEIFFEILT
ncbi:MAG: FtsQ-type POTRA domain-containing protein [Defluviitaleaceae bacterium]|nr:FtsQ-type POTRA domain-containing protein [Defluviitaleaceae bacterium]